MNDAYNAGRWRLKGWLSPSRSSPEWVEERAAGGEKKTVPRPPAVVLTTDRERGSNTGTFTRP